MIPFELTEPNEFDVADAEKFSSYSARINFSQKTEVYSENGYRFYGNISVVHQDKEIVLNLFKHATDFDSFVLYFFLDKIRNGYWKSFPWQQIFTPDGVQFDRVILGSNAEAKGLEIFPCTEELCKESGEYHLLSSTEFADGPIHTREEISHKKYRLQLIKEHGKKWCIDTEVYQELSVKDAASLASDISWLISEAKKGNGDS